MQNAVATRSSAHWQRGTATVKGRDLRARGWIGQVCVTYEQTEKEIADFVCPQNAVNRDGLALYVVNRRAVSHLQADDEPFRDSSGLNDRRVVAREPHVLGEVRNRETKWRESYGSNLRCSSSSSAAIGQMPILVRRRRQCYGDNGLLNSRRSYWMDFYCASHIKKRLSISFFGDNA